MTLAEAVAILNERKHRDGDGWFKHGRFVCSRNKRVFMLWSQAIAVAEKYQREAKG